jgi:hypothetical protein
VKPREAVRQERERTNALQLESVRTLEQAQPLRYVSGMPAVVEQPPRIDSAALALQLEAERYNLQRKVQAFFRMIQAAAKAPHCGRAYAECVQTVLLRATEAELFNPNEVE